MATLKHTSTGTLHKLAARHLIGRSASCGLRLTERTVSGEHAVVCWTGDRWEVQDLGSRNGTFVDGARVHAGDRRALTRGCQLRLGDGKLEFVLEDDAPPVATAQAADGTRQFAEGGILILPGPDDPQITIFEGGQGRWLAEASDGSRREVADRDTLRAGEAMWELHLPMVIESTWQPSEDELLLHQLTLRFAVSLDEEHVEASLIDRAGRVTAMPDRAHDYMLLVLARARLEDRDDPDIDPSERGWRHLEALQRMLACTDNTINVHIYRARKQLAMAGVQGATAVIERRAETGEIRLGTGSVEVITL